jgi:hypothetical protein
VIGALVPILTDDQQDVMSKLIDDAGPIAGLFVLLLGFGLFLLWRSMTRQLKRIDPDLPAGRDDRQQAFDMQLTEEAVEKGEDEAASDVVSPEADDRSQS